MADEIRVVGQVDIVKVVATLEHVVKEMARIGDVVENQGAEIAGLREDLRREIAALDKAQSLTDRELKWLVGKVAAIVAAAVTIGAWILKSGVAAALVGLL